MDRLKASQWNRITTVDRESAAAGRRRRSRPSKTAWRQNIRRALCM